MMEPGTNPVLPEMHMWIETDENNAKRICSFRDGRVIETAWEAAWMVSDQFPHFVKIFELSGILVHESIPDHLIP